MKKKTILGMPSIAFYIVCTVLVIGLIIGSFYDFQISESLSNKTQIGDFFQKYGNMLSNCMYIIAGTCIFKGLRIKGEKYNLIAWVILILSIFYSIMSSLILSGKYLREVYGYVAKEPNTIFRLVLCFLTLVALSSLLSCFIYKILDDKKSTQLIVIGSIIFVAGLFSIELNEWLKQVGNRPRYKYLITLDNPISEFRNFWQIRPYLNSDSMFQSWPSGHMTYASIMLCLPMLATVLKTKKEWLKYVFFAFACIWIVIFGYNRIHMNAHFLTDVCTAVLLTYCLYAIIYKCATKAFKIEEK